MPFQSYRVPEPPANPRRPASQLFCFLVAGALAITPAMAEEWPSQVDATYRVSFNGFDIGRFEFRSQVRGGAYAISGDAQLSALLGAFRWRGVTQSSGTVRATNPRPDSYRFDFNGMGKAGSIRVGFNRDRVNRIDLRPNNGPDPQSVPLKASHLRGVLDPLSAVLSLGRVSGTNPCAQRLSMFDGKQRFDLDLSFARQERVAEARPSGQPGVGYVCRVRYVPIAGHKVNSETQYMASNSGIEIALRPIPTANLFVPYRITIPTVAGTATLTSIKVNITTSNAQIALTH